MVNSKKKGARGELEFVDYLKARGYKARRGQQFKGGYDSPDVVHNVPGLHFEVKRTQALRLQDAIDQATSDKNDQEVAVVAYRRNKGKWIAILYMDDLLNINEQIELA